MNFRSSILVFALLSLLVSAGFAEETEKKSLWSSFTDFFSSKAKPEGDGELYKQLADIDNEIQETQWKYTREKRAVKKSRFKTHLEELHVSRDSLADVIRKQEATADKKSESKKQSEQAVHVKASEPIVQKNLPEPPKAELRPDSIVVTMTVTKFVHDTVYVYDTVFVCDTLHIK